MTILISVILTAKLYSSSKLTTLMLCSASRYMRWGCCLCFSPSWAPTSQRTIQLSFSYHMWNAVKHARDTKLWPTQQEVHHLRASLASTNSSLIQNILRHWKKIQYLRWTHFYEKAFNFGWFTKKTWQDVFFPILLAVMHAEWLGSYLWESCLKIA